jgi:molecular chaperone DnaK (HSP70)
LCINHACSVKKGMYTTVEDFQTSIDINIYEGERSHVEGNTQLGEFVISGIERGKRDTAKVEVSFEIDTNGILKVSARDKVRHRYTTFVHTHLVAGIMIDDEHL